MPSIDHEALVELFRNRPRLAAELLRDALHLDLPDFDDIATDSIEFNQIRPAEYRCDHVAVLKSAGKPVLALVIEVQLAEDANKLYSWPVYTAALRSRLRCDAGVLVICADDAVAAWATKPIRIGFSNVFQPLVIGPRGVPPITDPDQARQAPELAVLSAVSYGDHPDIELAARVALVAASAIKGLPPDQHALYLDMILAALSAAARKAFEMLPQGYEFRSEPMRQAQVRGRVEGQRDAIVRVLEARGVAITDEQRERITSCLDLDTLQAWVTRAGTVASADELFTE